MIEYFAVYWQTNKKQILYVFIMWVLLFQKPVNNCEKSWLIFWELFSHTQNFFGMKNVHLAHVTNVSFDYWHWPNHYVTMLHLCHKSEFFVDINTLVEEHFNKLTIFPPKYKFNFKYWTPHSLIFVNIIFFSAANKNIKTVLMIMILCYQGIGNSRQIV